MVWAVSLCFSMMPAMAQNQPCKLAIPSDFQKSIRSVQRGNMKLSLLAAALLIVTPALAQLPPAATLLPTGFQLELERNLGGTFIIEAKKPNESFPKGHMDQGIKLGVTLSQMPMSQQMLDMLAGQPEEPARQNPGSVTRSEPCGKQRHNNGILICRKSITPHLGEGSAPDLVTLDVSWVGKSIKGGMLTVGVSRFVGSKESAVGLIDSVVQKALGAN
jgi:hypothetical protein